MNVRDALERGHKSGYAVYREKACCLTGSTLYLAADRRKGGTMTTGCQHLAEFFASPHAAQIMASAATQVTGQDWGFLSVGSTVPGPAPKAKDFSRRAHDAWEQIKDDPAAQMLVQAIGEGWRNTEPKQCACKDEPVRLSDGRVLPVTIGELALSQAREDAAEEELAEIVEAFHLPADAPTFVFDGRA